MSLDEAQRAVVIDASAAIRFLQGDPDWLARWEDWTRRGDLVLVPPHFTTEVANGILRGSEGGSAATVATLVRDLFAVGFEVADRGLTGLEGSIELAARHGLTADDAAYLDLAIDVDGELATLDGDLRAAAAAESVPLVP